MIIEDLEDQRSELDIKLAKAWFIMMRDDTPGSQAVYDDLLREYRELRDFMMTQLRG